MTGDNGPRLLRLRNRHAHLRTVIAFFGTAGLRLGEALGLPWNHIDLVGGKLQVRCVL